MEVDLYRRAPRQELYGGGAFGGLSQLGACISAWLVRGLGEPIRLPIAGDPAVRAGPVDGDLIVPAEDSGADLHRRYGEALAGANSV